MNDTGRPSKSTSTRLSQASSKTTYVQVFGVTRLSVLDYGIAADYQVSNPVDVEKPQQIAEV